MTAKEYIKIVQDKRDMIASIMYARDEEEQEAERAAWARGEVW